MGTTWVYIRPAGELSESGWTCLCSCNKKRDVLGRGVLGCVSEWLSPSLLTEICGGDGRWGLGKRSVVARERKKRMQERR
jgi:hypothetical protein